MTLVASSDATHVETRVPVCRLDDLRVERGAAALVHGTQVALFRVVVDGVDQVFAIDHRDPIAGANVLARGLVGHDGSRWYVASPLLKHRFDLETGVCLDDPTVTISTWRADVIGGTVHIGA